jgi:predicted alpha/beta-hydrolase family hydrolase
MKSENIWLSKDQQKASAVLMRGSSEKPGVILAHGAGGNMHSKFIQHFQNRIVEHGYSCMRFNFFYSEAGKRGPDPQQLLVSCYTLAIDAMPAGRLVIGGKSMGGRIASYLADHNKVAGLAFLGYPLHPPGKTTQLRDAHLYSIRKPMLFLSGTRDPFARFDLLEATIRRIGKSATLHAVQEGGHSFEVPKKLNLSEAEVLESCSDALLNWLQQNF